MSIADFKALRHDVGTRRDAISGAVLLLNDKGYNDARSLWNANIDPRPKFIVQPTNTPDGAAAVTFAAHHDLGVAVKNTGHGAVVECDDVLIDLSLMRAVVIDEEAQVRTRERRGRLGRSLASREPLWSGVGYTLSGGYSWLSRSCGLAADAVAADAVVEAEVVTANGTIVRANEANHADLFWALRGSGENFGIVTELTFRLYPLAEVYGGALIFPIDGVRDILARFAAWTLDLPDSMTSSVAIMRQPDAPSERQHSSGLGTGGSRECGSSRR
jgi:FAD/FMN-containing dehydrogenase